MTQISEVESPTLVEPARPGLADLIRQIRMCTREASDPATIATMVAEVLVSAEPTTALLTEQERAGGAEGYTRHTLHAEANFSISAVVWRPGQLTEIHDHLVWCSWMVLQGCESETLFGFEDGRLVEIGSYQRPAGSASGVAPPDDIHRVANKDDVVAITLHVYGADLSEGTSVRRTYEVPTGRPTRS